MSNRSPARLFVLAERVEGEVILSNYYNPMAIERVSVLTKPSGHKKVIVHWNSGKETALEGSAAESFLKSFERGESR